MDFHVYPDTPANPQEHPLEILPGDSSTLATIEKFTGPGSVGTSNYENVMFIRVALLASGTVAEPTIRLQVTNNTNTPPVYPGNLEPIIGDAPPDDAPATGYGTQILDGENVPVAYGFKYGEQGNNVYLIKVVVGELDTSWKMSITNNDSSLHEFTWVVANSDGKSKQPWIEVETTQVDFPGHHLTGVLSNPKPITIHNRGTGTLTLTKPEPIPPSTTIDWSLGNGFHIFDYDTEGEPFPATVEPNEEPPKVLKVQFKLDTVGPANSLEYFIVCDDTTIPAPGTVGITHTNKVTLTGGTAGSLEVILLLDGSGSMAWDPQGNMGVPPEQSRWSHLTGVVHQFLTLLGNLGEGTGRFGVAVFPDITQPPVTAPSANSLPYAGGGGSTEATEITTEITTGDAIGKAKGAVDGQQQPTGRTPMGKGIEVTIGAANAYGYFQSSQAEIEYNERWLVLMSDGEHNWPPPVPEDFYKTNEGLSNEPGNAGPGESFIDKAIKVFTIGYGDPESTVHVNNDLLKRITSKSGVAPDGHQDGHQAVSATETEALAMAFRRFIEDAFGLQPESDPPGVLTGGTPPTRHHVTVTPYDSKVIFVVDWWNFGCDRVEVSLVTPLCEVITAEDAMRTNGLSYHEHNRYKMFIVDDGFLRNKAGEPRYGAWTLKISGQHLDEGDSEPYAYSVITRSRAQMAIGVSRRRHAAGRVINIKANMTIDGAPLPNPSFTLHVTEPVYSKHNWLARTHVSGEDYYGWEKELAGQDVNALDLKARVAAYKGLKFENILRSRSMPMVRRRGKSSTYVARIENTTVPGTYAFRVTAVAETTSGVVIRRERTITVHVGVRPEAEHTLVDIDYRRVLEGKATMNQINVWVMPRDRFCNVVLVDPKNDPSICITAKGAEPTDDLIGHLNGSYSRTFRYVPGTEPSINLRVGGRKVVPKLDLAPAEKLDYVNCVFTFIEGHEATKGENQHNQPEAILGSVLDKDPDEFVSLGGFGSITVGFDGKGILAAGEAEDDITVFVRRDEDLRPYAVEVLAGDKDAWVELGTSPGVTQSFSLGKPGVRAAKAIRITDRSGRTTDRGGKPIATPGVSIRGVGVIRVE